MDSQAFQKLSDRIKSYRDHVVEIQTKLTANPAIAPESGGEGEAKKAEYIKELLNGIGYDSLEEINAPDDRVPAGYRPNLIVRFNGKSDKKTVWIMAHTDVVPPGEMSDWETDPYQVVEKDGKLYGRGTEDNQQALVSAVLAVKSLREENIPPAYDVGLALVADEEVGSKYGIDYVIENHPDIFKKEDLILIPDAGDPEGILIEVAEKSILWVKAETTGRQTHGSTPEKGVNAHKAAAHFIVKMNELYKIYDKNDPLYDPPISTFEPTKKEANVDNINTIPGKDVTCFDCRILPDYPLEDVKKQIRVWADEIQEEFGVTLQLAFPQDGSAPAPTPPDAPVAEALKRAVKEVTGKDAKTIGIGGGTVAASFREAGLPAVCWGTLDETLHGPNEYCKIDNVVNDALVFAHIFMQE